MRPGRTLHTPLIAAARARARALARALALALTLPLLAGATHAQGAETPCADAALQAEVLQRLNTWRVQGLACGGQAQSAVGALSWSAPLARAAEGHARDLAAQGRLAHAGSDGQRGGDRAQQAGYAWASWAENLALGPRSAEALLSAWAASPTHCRNLMQPDVQQAGLACAAGRGGRPYWVLMLGEPALPTR